MLKFHNIKLPTLLTAAAVVAICASGPAHAGLEIQLASGSDVYSLTGSSPLYVSAQVGNFTVASQIGTSGVNPTLLDLGSIDFSTAVGGTLVVTVSENGFTAPAGAANWLSQVSAHFVTGTGTVEMQTYIDNNNTLLGTGTLLSTLTGLSASATATAVTGTPFALTEVLTLVTSGGSLLSLDASVVDAPEPASMALLGVGTIGLGAIRRRKVA